MPPKDRDRYYKGVGECLTFDAGCVIHYDGAGMPKLVQQAAATVTAYSRDKRSLLLREGLA